MMVLVLMRMEWARLIAWPAFTVNTDIYKSPKSNHYPESHVICNSNYLTKQNRGLSEGVGSGDARSVWNGQTECCR
jgi:hypothetical protein